MSSVRPVRALVVLVLAAVVGAACSGGAKKTSPPTTTVAPSTVATTTTPTIAPTTTTKAAPSTTTATTVPVCPGAPGAGAPAAHATNNAVLLTNVTTLGDRCTDRVVFDFTAATPGVPGYVVTAGAPPFHEDASGNPVTVAGTGFIVVTIKPGYTYDYENGRRTYNGPARITPSGAAHVRAIVRTGDFEGVLTWVIGTDGKRPYTVNATGGLRPQLVVSVY